LNLDKHGKSEAEAREELERRWQADREKIRRMFHEEYAKDHERFLKQIEPYRKYLQELRVLDKDNIYEKLLTWFNRTIAGYE